MRSGVRLIICVLVAAELYCAGAIRCNREPEEIHSSKSADNRFQIRISGNPDKYMPGGTYAVTLQGQSVGRYRPNFKRFMLVVEPSYSYLSSWEDSAFGHRNVGSFTLAGDNRAKYSTHCPNAIVQTSSLKMSQVEVTWTAPPPGSGCVVFRATVVEDHEVWYKDDGLLSLLLCEDVQENEFDQPEFVLPCCACDDALYEMTYEGVWSKPTHPKEFPPNEWLTGFSDLIGASHSADYRFWEYGTYATEGLQLVAEFGTTHALEREIMDKSEHVRTIIKARGLSYPNVTGKTSAVFRVDMKNHLVSVVSRIDPSPDWIVGVSGFNLCLKNCSWIDYKVLNLYPWDAGTDSGMTYMSPDMPSSQHETVSRITSSYPNDPRSPFYDASGSEIQPLARLYLKRQQLFEKECDQEEVESNGGSEPEPPEYCSVSEWSEWSYCSVTCGTGEKYRQRSYLDKKKAQLMACNEELAEQDVCQARQETCSLQVEQRSPKSICATTEWSAWSECSVSCGIGELTRTRHYKSRKGHRRCSRRPDAPQLEQKIVCQGSESAECKEESQANEIDVCPNTEWSAWSPCSASCGKGQRIRKRIPVLEEPTQADTEDDNLLLNCPEGHITEVQDCIADFPSCVITPNMYREFCKAPMEKGACQGQNSRWFYNAETETCQEFIYKGCYGNRNNYLTEEVCEKTCKGYEGPEPTEDVTEDTTMTSPFNGLWPASQILDLETTTYGLEMSTVPMYNFETETETETEPVTVVEGPIMDCDVSRWTRWSKCSVSCGRGFKTRSRTIQVHPRNGGKACPKLFKKKKCGKKCDSDTENEMSDETNYENDGKWSRGY